MDRQQTVDLFELLDQADLSRAQESEVLPEAVGDSVRPKEPALPDRTGQLLAPETPLPATQRSKPEQAAIQRDTPASAKQGPTELRDQISTSPVQNIHVKKTIKKAEPAAHLISIRISDTPKSSCAIAP